MRAACSRCVTKVVVTILEIRSPIHGDYRGMRIVAALPNRAGRFGSVSYDKPYFVDDAVYVSEGDRDRFEARLTEQGYFW